MRFKVIMKNHDKSMQENGTIEMVSLFLTIIEVHALYCHFGVSPVN